MTKAKSTPRTGATAARGWLAIGATSVLGLGLLATSAVSIAGAMPLVDSTTESSVPPITTLSLEEGKGVGGGDSSGEMLASAATAPTPSPASPPAVEQAPAPAPQPVAPAPAGSVSAESAESAESAASAESAD